MTMIFTEGFDHILGWSIKWDSCQDQEASTISSETPYNNGRSYQLATGIYGSNIGKRLVNKDGVISTHKTFCFGAHVRPPSHASGPDVRILNGLNQEIVAWAIDSGNLKLKLFGNVVASVSGEISGAYWQHLECKITIDGGTATAVLRKNGMQVAQGSVSTGVSPEWALLEVLNQSSGFQDPALIDDIYTLDGDGPDNNDLLGPCRVITLWPSAVGPDQDFIPSSGYTSLSAMEIELVSEDTYGGYVESGIVGAAHNYKQHLLSSSLSEGIAKVYSVQTTNCVRRSDAQATFFKNQIVANGTPYNGYEEADAAYDFHCVMQMWDKYPSGELPWTVELADLTGSGIKITYRALS